MFRFTRAASSVSFCGKKNVSEIQPGPGRPAQGRGTDCRLRGTAAAGTDWARRRRSGGIHSTRYVGMDARLLRLDFVAAGRGIRSHRSGTRDSSGSTDGNHSDPGRHAAARFSGGMQMTHDTHQKVNSIHLKRTAYLYIRQSTLRQVLENTESTKRQYGLRQKAIALGWPADRIVVIDSDLGQSGASAADREGFQRLVTEVSLGRAGIVLGLEVSRLARNNTDWHRLLEICALTDTLILDEDGIYDPSHFNDRLLLGLNRPETQSTSNSTFCWTGSFGQFRVGTRVPAPQAISPADISDVVTRKAPAKRTAQPGAIQRRGDFGVGTLRRQFVNPRNSVFRSFQRAFSRCRPLHVEDRYGADAPSNLHHPLPRLRDRIDLHLYDHHTQ